MLHRTTMDSSIVNWITGKADLQQVSLQELKNVTDQYPYFTLAQLLLTVKMKKDNDPGYPRQLQKTALNFQNPQWLHFQLESLERSLVGQQEITSVAESQPTALEENVATENIAGKIPQDETHTESIDAENTIEETTAPSTSEATANIEEEPQEAIQEEVTKPEDSEPVSRLSSMLEAQAAAFKTADISNESLSYDNPKLLPTKDYFASIGITADNTINTDFGQKVKRFSDWLKQMKRIGNAEIEKNADPNEDKIIMQKANDSNKNPSILTEAMVDVLVQQGKKEEAVEMLEKLSLLKPEKSSYFASLIHDLKNNN
ncbi:MAG: hypothetical protein QM610_00425 [Chitinophagaceae bacterium]